MEAKTEIQVEVKEERDMTEAEVESVASLLFTWWKREYEERSDNEQSGDEEIDV
jgi:hypothetical protein